MLALLEARGVLCFLLVSSLGAYIRRALLTLDLTAAAS